MENPIKMDDLGETDYFRKHPSEPKADVERIIIAYVTKKSAAKAAANAARHKAEAGPQQIFLV